MSERFTDRKYRYAIDLPATHKGPEHEPIDCLEGLGDNFGRTFTCPTCQRKHQRTADEIPWGEGLVCYGDGTIESRGDIDE